MCIMKNPGGDMIPMPCFNSSSTLMSRMMIEEKAYVINDDVGTWNIDSDHQLLSISRDSGSVSISYSTSTLGPALHQLQSLISTQGGPK